jgi:hypothetical protein
MSVHFKYDLKDLDLFGDNKDKTKENEDKYKELKIRIDENIKLLKEQIFQLFDMSYKNKNDIENILKIIGNINNDISKMSNDIEEYKKITNERIEKIFKLVMITNEKLNKQ